ncbi:MAG: GT-D fold domain-containing glycosyltransferase [Neisseria sp.]|uniref:GT-D fold domain-containing glycosyltransferase n=1 Tax=Neisseria sp. TaxID=192066 RepID=UPI0026DCE882|nr:GT-D fold domain-containing glycosyltransferase [Neisseria sp.]MDO4640274.1 GT-D fold domain-containing glycosyltransferase [Neisseria sp.]
MSNQNLDTQTILASFKMYFGNFSFIKKIDIYKDVVFLEIKTELLAFALEFKHDGSCEIVFRNDITTQHFSIFFDYPFTKGTPIYLGNICVNNLFHTDTILMPNDMHLFLERAKRILNKCLKVEKEPFLWLKTSNLNLKKSNEINALQLRNDVLLDMTNHMQNRLLSILETMHRIKNEELSIARFGDGEINCMITETGCSFQTHNWKLMQELRDMNMTQNGLLVCYPSLMVENGFWLDFWAKHWAQCKFYLQREVLGDSFVTRPQAFYLYGHIIADMWKEIWENKHVCFITGEGSRMDGNHFIFDNIKNSSYIYSKTKNAYEDIDNIIHKSLKQSNVDLFLIALGPTGTAVASRLYNKGYRALDIGHLNNSYDTAFHNAPRPEHITYL